MISGIIKALVEFFSSGVGNKIGTGLVDIAALAAVATPVILWFLGHKDEIALTLTWSQMLFFGIVLAAIVKIAHYTRAGNASERNYFRG